MKTALLNIVWTGSDWRDALRDGFDPGISGLFNIEWLIDRAERGDWSGSWW